MAFAGEATAAAILVFLTLLIQTTGMATLIQWIRARHTKGMYPVGVLGGCFMMLRFTSAMFVLHLLEILPWAGFYRWRCRLSWEAALVRIDSHLAHYARQRDNFDAIEALDRFRRDDLENRRRLVTPA
jgi:hypothetical protein